MPSNETLEMIVAIGAGIFLISYPVFLRIEWKYYIKHRQELTQLLYGNDPFESDKKLYWTDHLMMSVGIFFGLFVAWREKNNKRLPKEGLTFFAPNILENGNYRTLSKNHPSLKKLQLAHLVIGLIFLACGGLAYYIKDFIRG